MQLTSLCVILVSAYLTAFCALHAAGDRCAKLGAIRECAREFIMYAEHGMNVTMAVRGFPNAIDELQRICSNIPTVDSCMSRYLGNCDEFTDADEYLVATFDRYRATSKRSCGNPQAPRVLRKVQDCFDSRVSAEVIKCDTPDGDRRRRRRHSCSDLNNEIRCVDEKVRNLCHDDEISFLVGNGFRQSLRDHPHTYQCPVPPLTGSQSGLSGTSHDDNKPSSGSIALGVWSTAASAVSALCTLYHVYSAV